MEEISLKDVAEKYNNIEIIWNDKDKWHLHTKKMISEFINKTLKTINNLDNYKILNAGSAGYSYGLDERKVLHVDIAENRLKHVQNTLVADIQKIPLPEQQFDMIICVGSVINYCDPLLVIKEFRRLLKKNGCIILEFENSYSLELLGKKSFNKKATIVNSFYNGQPEKVWFFSESYIEELAELYHLKVSDHKRCHIFSPLIYRLFPNENFASRFGKLDKIAAKIPVIKKFSSNTIFFLTDTQPC